MVTGKSIVGESIMYCYVGNGLNEDGGGGQ